MFVYNTKIKMHHVDPARIVFFGNYFVLAHDAYESFLEYLTYDPKYIFDDAYLIPIVHAECDYKIPAKLGDKLTFELKIDKIGRTSFTLKYRVLNQDCKEIAELKTVHAFVSQKSKKPVAIPKDFRESLERLAHDEKSGQTF